ncbi:CCA tRNA nucleotidyltransferase [Actibacterium ureilyticum]|uniref:CCA tRNA nucleotidyltransferase n=1 Tax=Actibacterium ureilyticum TaxID=1590614 RepID=UPI000BAAF690|nr:CCA tRNA nucleotidyltransferase [Actibacterium ureilyticum]
MTRIDAPWIRSPEVQSVCAMLTAAGHQALFVGGCVRNALLGAGISDIDISTDARPDRVMELAEQAGLKAVPTGIDHGTVTVIADGHPFEVTTFRRDVETDGRRAVVAFADRIDEDAHRRDFTMNALYATPEGEILDPLGGLPDLQARRVRFIDEAEARIREDYLRILRYFRFHAWYGDPEMGFDPEALAACAALSDGLETLSKERIGAEVKKLLAAPDPAPSVATMAQAGILGRILPGADPRALPILTAFEAATDLSPDPIRRLAALNGPECADLLRLSRDETRALAALRDGATGTAVPRALGYRLGVAAARDAVLLRASLMESPLPAGWPDDIATGAAAEFPVKARDLMPDYQGPALGAKLAELEDRWIASGFALDKEALLH